MEVVRRRTSGIVVVTFAVVALLLGAGCGGGAPAPGDLPQSVVDTVVPSVATESESVEQSSAVLHLPSETVRQEEEMSFSAEGFAPFEEVVLQAVVKEGEPPTELWRGPVDESGRLPEQRIVLPEWLTSGERTLDLVSASGTRASAPIAIRAKQHWIEAGSYSVQVAKRLGFIAGGFEPGERVRVYFGSQETPPPDAPPLVVIDADRVGNTTWQEIDTPVVVAGPHHLILVGETSGASVERTIQVEPLTPGLELEPWSGPPGSPVQITGHGFLPGESINVFVGGTQPALTIAADEWGNFWSVGPVNVPLDAGGSDVTITVVGEQSQTPASANFGVWEAEAWLELSTYAGYAGSSVLFHGGGLGTGERVRIYRMGERDVPVSETTTFGDGRFWNAGPAQISSAVSGKVSFIAIGEQTGARAIATFEVIEFPTYGIDENRQPVYPDATVEPAGGADER